METGRTIVCLRHNQVVTFAQRGRDLLETCVATAPREVPRPSTTLAKSRNSPRLLSTSVSATAVASTWRCITASCGHELSASISALQAHNRGRHGPTATRS